jgi:transaldolase/glucose-6-phosphate isomerase
MHPNNLIDRIWQKDLSLWSNDVPTANSVENRLGWLDCVSIFEPKLGAIRAFADSLPYSNVVLVGMGGSSLVSKIFVQAFPDSKRSFHVLDTTDPATILSIQEKIPLNDTLFIVASKSGTTIEVDSLLDYFFNLCPRPEQFIAITDFNTPLMKRAEQHRFRHIFINPADIGGRFAALSYFGLIPFALLGGDIIGLMKRAKEITEECKKNENNPAIKIAELLFENHQAGRNKLYFNVVEKYSTLTYWIEQLIAESTGKQDKGIIPVLTGKPGSDGFAVDISIESIQDLACEFFGWEMTTAMLGAMMEINPFDEPNVVESKKNTINYLQHGSNITVEKKINELAQSRIEIEPFLEGIEAPEFVAILSYANHHLPELNRNFGVPIIHCSGPGYLHSTGQLHKGGPNQGRFIIIIDNQKDLPIPGRNYGFQTLKLAQALGDYEALKHAGRKVMMVHI